METVTSVLALIAGIGSLLLVVAYFVGDRVAPLASASRWAHARRAELTLAVAGVATLGSFYFSEIADYVPCRLCWFQRIAMYPIALIALVALIRRDVGAKYYTVPLASIGLVISTYHYLIERGVVADSESCSIFGPPCAAVWFERFGFVTLAFMALCGFVAIIILNVVPAPRSKEDS